MPKASHCGVAAAYATSLLLVCAVILKSGVFSLILSRKKKYFYACLVAF